MGGPQERKVRAGAGKSSSVTFHALAKAVQNDWEPFLSGAVVMPDRPLVALAGTLLAET
jgi:hypothetical protein